MAFLLKFWREGVILILSGVLLFLFSIRPATCPEVVTAETTSTLLEKEKTSQTVKTVIKKPDGTVIEKIKETQKTSKVSKKASDKITVTRSKSARYQVGAAVNPRNYGDYSIDVGVRLGDTPLFGTIEYQFKDRTILIGVRAEF